MASSSSRGLRHSTKNSLSTAQVIQGEKSLTGSQSRTNSNGSSKNRVRNGSVSRRRSAPSTRRSRVSQTQTSTTKASQRSKTNVGRHIIGFDDDTDDDDNGNKHMDELNISSTSAATDNMELSQHDDDDSSTVAVDNNNQHDKTAIKKTELINQYFVKLNTGGYYCKLCDGTKNSKKVLKQASYSDANLRSHLARHHKLTHLLYPSQRKRYEIKPQILTVDLKKKLDDALLYAIIKDSRSFGDFRKPGFQHFLQVVLPDTNYKGPHRTTIRKRMGTLYSVYRKALVDELSLVNDIALTTDSWASPRRVHFVCITAHYYNGEYGYLSKVISFRRFIGRSFALRLRKFIRLELKKLKIQNKICAITTDNGPNIKLATNTNEFGIHIPCLVHGLHLTVTNGLGLWQKKKKKSSVQVTAEDEEQQQPQNDYSDTDDYEDQIWEDDIESDRSNDSDVSDEETMNDHSYNSNRNLEDTYSEDDDEDTQSLNDSRDENETDHTLKPDAKEVIYNLLRRTRALINAIHRSSNLDKYVRDRIYLKQQDSNKRAKEDNTNPILYNELIVDFRIRWSSTFHMLNRFNILSSILNDVTCTPKNIEGVESQQVLKLSKLAFSHDDWNCLSALEYVLKCFEESTRLLSGRTYQTLALGKMIINGLKHFLSHHKSNEPIVNALKTLLLPKFEEYCEQNFSLEAKEAITIASFLNPTTFFYLQEDEQFIKNAKQLLVLKSKSPKFSSIPLSSSNSAPVTRTLPKTLKKPLLAIEAFLSNCEAPLPSRPTTSSTAQIFTIHQEIGYYISSIDRETEFQEYWNKNQHSLPILSRLVRHYCIIPMASVASESAFSIAGYIQRKHRSSLSATTLRYSMLLRNFEAEYISSN